MGGHCAGSWVALEMARQLQRDGEEIDLLLLVDYGPPGAVRRVNPITYLWQRMRYYIGSGRLLDAIRWKLAVARERFLVRRLGDDRSRRAAEVRSVHAQAFGRYRGGAVDGDAVLVRSVESVGFADRDWHLDWRELVRGELRTVVVPGSHAGLVEDLPARELADVMGDALLDARRPAPPHDARG